MEYFNTIISYLTSLEVQERLLSWRIVGAAFSLFFLFGVIFLLLRTQYARLLFVQDLAEIITYRPYGIKKVVKHWKKITNRLVTGAESDYKLAILEAEDLLDDMLKRMGFAGESLIDRLQQLTVATLPNIDQLLEAHKIRDSVLHDPDYRLTLEETRKTLEIYEKALSDLQAF